MMRFYDKIEVLCQSIFKSPYFYNKSEIINTHDKNIELKTLKLIVEFINKNIDNNINSIELTEKNEIKRFLVDSQKFPEKSINITNYGEGLQRIFEIALSFAYCKNGVVLIDEFETAIHYSLLVNFTGFIQELADKFNVQVFLTSHSKECIEAFVNNNYKNENISLFTMVTNKNEVKTVNYDHEYLINKLNQNLEIRGW
jgi:AAA15 family ATPase/GTPase